MPARRRERNGDQSDSNSGNNNNAASTATAAAATATTAAVFTRIAFVQRICMFAVDSVAALVAAAGVNAAFRECVGCSAEHTFLPRAMLDALCADDGPAWREDDGCLPKLLRPRNWIEEDDGEPQQQQQQQHRIKAHTPEWVFRLLGAQASTWRPVGYAVTHDAPQALCEHLYERFLLPAREWHVAPRDTAGGAGAADDGSRPPLPPLREHPDFAHLSDAADNTHPATAVPQDVVTLLPAVTALLDHAEERVVLHGAEMVFLLHQFLFGASHADALDRARDLAIRRCLDFVRCIETATHIRREACKSLSSFAERFDSWFPWIERSQEYCLQLHRIDVDLHQCGAVPVMLNMLKHRDAVTRGYAARFLAHLFEASELCGDAQCDNLAVMQSCQRAILDSLTLPCTDLDAQVNCIEALRFLARTCSGTKRVTIWRPPEELSWERLDSAQQLADLHLPIMRALLESNSAPKLVIVIIRFLFVAAGCLDKFDTFHLSYPPVADPYRPALLFLSAGLVPAVLAQLRSGEGEEEEGRSEENHEVKHVIRRAAEVLEHLAMSRDARAQLFTHGVPAALCAALSRDPADKELASTVASATIHFLRWCSTYDDARPLFDSGLVLEVARQLWQIKSNPYSSQQHMEAAAKVLGEAWRVCSGAQVQTFVDEHDVLTILIQLLKRACLTHSYEYRRREDHMRLLDRMFSRVDGTTRQRYLERFKALGGDDAIRRVAHGTCVTPTRDDHTEHAQARAFLTKYRIELGTPEPLRLDVAAPGAEAPPRFCQQLNRLAEWLTGIGR
jgi:hypothetical protein